MVHSKLLSAPSSRDVSGIRAVTAAFAAVGLLMTVGACSGADANNQAVSRQTLTIGAPTPPLSLDPAKNGGGVNELFVDLAYQALIHAKPNGSYTPMLAESFGYVGKGHRQFEITLRPGVTFSDGTSLDSAAVKTYLEYFRSAGGPFSATAKNITAIETPDAKTVVLRLAGHDPDMPLNFSEAGAWGNVVSPKVLKERPATLGSSTAGAGPYMLDTAASVQGSTYTYVPNPRYRGPSTRQYSKVVIKVIPNSTTAFQALRSGQIQFMQGDTTLLAKAKRNGLKTHEQGAGFVGLFLQDREGKKVEALGDVRVRQAINHAIDRRSLAKAIGGSTGEPLSQIIAPGAAGYSKDLEKRYPYDLGRARKLLNEAGYEDGFSFTVLTGAFDPVSAKLAAGIAEQLKAVGITMTIESKTAFPDYARAQESGAYPANVANWGATTMYAAATQLVLPEGVVNPFHTSDEQMEKLYREAAALPASKSSAKWRALSARVSHQAWFAPVMMQKAVFIAPEGLEGYSDNASYPNPVFIRNS
ncbi:ABC transporter substrate-binding protein [Streptomyces zagrosensis]|uniref:Peptide/nickel transport system substrate-binding protein n=1 Tax=Streptomyces zagrosensis TaxID=1042984 RepID=A0A7W9QG30_9ACTN|nr:ABC transporter substrate-binding protein [Streptomyces zagrosensis]MBB5938577.1 peptide/nickel transport system substrate-binding protein [Streptomyces zagrosensis]